MSLELYTEGSLYIKAHCIKYALQGHVSYAKPKSRAGLKSDFYLRQASRQQLGCHQSGEILCQKRSFGFCQCFWYTIALNGGKAQKTQVVVVSFCHLTNTTVSLVNIAIKSSQPKQPEKLD